MPKLTKATERDKRSFKAKHTTRTSRAFLHTLDRLAAERDRKLQPVTERPSGGLQNRTNGFDSRRAVP